MPPVCLAPVQSERLGGLVPTGWRLTVRFVAKLLSVSSVPPPFDLKAPIFGINDTVAVFTEDVKGEKDAGKEAKAAKEETAKGNGKPPAERPRFMFNIADGGFTGES